MNGHRRGRGFYHLNKKDKDKKLKSSVVLKNNFWMLKKLWKYTPSYVVFTVIQGIERGVGGFIGMLYLKFIMDYLEKGEPFVKYLNLSIAFFIYWILSSLYHNWYWQIFLPKTREKLHMEMYCDLFKQAQRLDLEKYDDPEFYNDFIWSLEQSYQRSIDLMQDTSLLIHHIISSISLISLILTIDVWMALVILLVSVIRMISTKNLNKEFRSRFEEFNPIYRMDGYIRRVFMLPDYSKETRATDVKDVLLDEFHKNTERKNSIAAKHSKKIILYSSLCNILPFVGEVIIYLILIRGIVVTGKITLGSLAVATNSIWRISWSMRDLVTRLMKYHEHALYIDKIMTFMSCEPNIISGNLKAPAFETLTIKNVGFSYKKDNKTVNALNNVNMEIKKGEKIAIVGYNGAGKTTLTKLILRLYDPMNGEILYNGINLKEYSIDELRKRTVSVFQDYKIFAGTIAENVVAGETDGADENEIIEALTHSTFDKKLSQLEKGIDTILTREFYDDGTQLSGGEQQKIAIARAFYKNADIIVLDEPSSALDPEAEYQLNRSITEYAKDKTVIFISHRLSTTRHADRIYMFDSGEIIESGSHKELMKLGGKYAYMFNLQAEKYNNP